MDIRSEIPRENRYVKVATNVADRVIKELYDNVISRIPFTKWKNMAAVFSSDHIDSTANKIITLVSGESKLYVPINQRINHSFII